MTIGEHIHNLPPATKHILFTIYQVAFEHRQNKAIRREPFNLIDLYARKHNYSTNDFNQFRSHLIGYVEGYTAACIKRGLPIVRKQKLPWYKKWRQK